MQQAAVPFRANPYEKNVKQASNYVNFSEAAGIKKLNKITC